MKKSINSNRLVNGQSKLVTINNLKGINILFGKNGTGKSTFLRNIYQSNTEEFHLVVPERGGNEMKYNAGYFDQENDIDQRKSVRQKNYDNAYRNRAISRTSMILNAGGHKYYSGDTESKIGYEDIANLFRVFLPEFKILFDDKAPHTLKIYREDHEGSEVEVTSADQLSSGQSEAISLASDIITQGILWSGKGYTLLIDEPDAHLHIDLENRFSIFIEEIKNKFDIQIILATHSHGLVASLLNLSDDVGVICFDDKNDTISTVQKNQAHIFTNLLSADLSLAVILKKKILIIEGNDDFLVWNQACRSQNFEDVSIIQSNGGDILKYKKNAEEILKVVLDRSEQFGMTILDGDGKGEFTNTAESTFPCFRLQCFSLENLFLTNEVLQYVKSNINLEEELGELKESVESEEEATIDKILKNKKAVKISKELIKKICVRIDEHSSARDWRVILGKVLGKERPGGELEEYLGEDIVKYIWGDLEGLVNYK
ncbi:MAG: AAA family ATPase [Patescibacteria group bacterium]